MKQLDGKLPMMTLNTEPAFPVNGATSWYPGMTLRDYFAAQALPIVLKNIMKDVDWELCPQWAAKEAYNVADAMINARDERL